MRPSRLSCLVIVGLCFFASPLAAAGKDKKLSAKLDSAVHRLAVMQLVEQGKIDVDDPIEKFIPENRQPVTGS